MSAKDLSHDHLVEALYQNYGIIGSTIDWIEEKYGYRISRHTVMSRIKTWGMEDYVTDCRIRGVDKARRKRFANGIDNGIETALGWIIHMYGHHAEFLEPRDESGLEINKGAISKYYEWLKHQQLANDTGNSETFEETD